MGRALILIDIQNDFMPGGALPVADGDAVVAVANSLMPYFNPVIASQDWHPAFHGSFASTHPGKRPGQFIKLGGVDQILWPSHCAQNTPGASFHSGLNVDEIDTIVRKGQDPGIDSYSAFYDNGHKKDTGLAEILDDHNVEEVYLLGLATDYCVKFTALDARQLGLAVTVVTDGCRAVNIGPNDGKLAFEEMAAAGCHLVTSKELAHIVGTVSAARGFF